LLLTLRGLGRIAYCVEFASRDSAPSSRRGNHIFQHFFNSILMFETGKIVFAIRLMHYEGETFFSPPISKRQDTAMTFLPLEKKEAGLESCLFSNTAAIISSRDRTSGDPLSLGPP